MAQLRLDYKNGLIPNLHWSKFEFTREEVEQLLDGKNPREGVVFLRREEMEEEDSWSSYHRIYFKKLGVGDCPTEVYHFITESRYYGDEDGCVLKAVFPGSMNILPIEINMDLIHYGVNIVSFLFTYKEMSDIINNRELPNFPCISNVIREDLSNDATTNYNKVRILFTLILDQEYYFYIDTEVRNHYKPTEENYIAHFSPNTFIHLKEPYIGASFNYYKDSTEALQAENEKLKEELRELKNKLAYIKETALAGLIEVKLPLSLDEALKLYGFAEGEPVYFMTVRPGEKVYKCVE